MNKENKKIFAQHLKLFYRQAGGIKLHLIQQIKEIDPSERDNSNKDKTFEILSKAGFTRQEHNQWRDTIMLDIMADVAAEEWGKLNSENLQIQGEYEDNISDRTEHMRWKDISLTLHEIEIMAAEKWAKFAQEHMPKEAVKAGHQTSNDLLTYNQLKKQIKDKDAGATDGAIQKRVYEAVQKVAQEGFQLPIFMSGCAKGYQLVALGEKSPNEKQPRITTCIYQKIDPG